MGAAASTSRDDGNNGDANGPLKCSLTDDQVQEYANSSHFTPEEIIALHIHYDQISCTDRDDGLIDQGEFQTALGFTSKASLYVNRIFHLFDSNDDSYISFGEFVQSVSILSSKGTSEEKLKFSFDLLDLDRDGYLSKQELLTMIEACVQENGIDIPRQSLEKIIDKTFEDVDKDGDGLVSFLEYKSLAESNPGMLSHMTFNIAGIIAEYLPALRAAALSRVKN